MVKALTRGQKNALHRMVLLGRSYRGNFQARTLIRLQRLGLIEPDDEPGYWRPTTKRQKSGK